MESIEVLNAIGLECMMIFNEMYSYRKILEKENISYPLVVYRQM